MPIGNNGVGIWDTDSAVNKQKGGVSVDGNILSMVGDAALTPKFNNGGKASAGTVAPSNSSDQGSGNPNKPSPDPSLLGRGNTDSMDQGTGSSNRPSPDASLIRGSGKKASNRTSSFGGVEKGVQIQ